MTKARRTRPRIRKKRLRQKRAPPPRHKRPRTPRTQRRPVKSQRSLRNFWPVGVFLFPLRRVDLGSLPGPPADPDSQHYRIRLLSIMVSLPDGRGPLNGRNSPRSCPLRWSAGLTRSAIPAGRTGRSDSAVHCCPLLRNTDNTTKIGGKFKNSLGATSFLTQGGDLAQFGVGGQQGGRFQRRHMRPAQGQLPRLPAATRRP